MELRVRSYGDAGPVVVVLHGGPGAPGYVAPLARALADRFRVLEPFQRDSGPEPLSVDRHVEDLLGVADGIGPSARPALVGSSWGAMLALAFAGKHPDRAGPLVLVGCGTFDRGARAEFERAVAARMEGPLRARMAALETEIADPDERLRRRGDLLFPLYSFDPIAAPSETGRCSARAHRETWRDAVRLQDEGVHPAAFAAIRSPVLMLHGDHDPHPGPRIRDSLLPHLPQLEYREFAQCGHFPWVERRAREEFLAVLGGWLGRHTGRA